MIRTTLRATQAATFALTLPDPCRQGFPMPNGTAFLVSPAGHVVTAAHVIGDAGTRTLDPGLDRAELRKEARFPDQIPAPICRPLTFLHVDWDLDFALLQADLQAVRPMEWFEGRDAFPYLRVATEPLEEGEPVYSFGYPLSEPWFEKNEGISMGGTGLSPRTTSAIVSSTCEVSGPVMTPGDAQVYVLDRALNYGNSGGPILSVATGHVHAICCRFQPLYVPQEHLKGSPEDPDIHIMTPSLYGIVTSLRNPKILDVLVAHGIPPNE